MTTARSRLRSPFQRYAEVVRLPGAKAFFTTAAIARLGVAMTGLGLLFSVRQSTGSFATAGVATGGFAVAEAVFGPQVARLVDRWGQTRVVPVVVVAHVTAVAIAITTVGRTPFVLTLVAVIVAGAAIPQPGALSAARWSSLIQEPERLRVAFSLEATINDVVFLTGPILVTLISTLAAPWAGSAAAATLLAVGCEMLALQRGTAPPLVRSAETVERTGRSSLRRPAFFAVLGVNLGLGCFFGSVGLLVTAATTPQGLQSLTGLILSLSSAASIVAGLVYGSLHSAPRPQRVQLIATGTVTLGVLVAVLSPTVLGLTIMQFIGGCAIAPLLASSSQITQATVAASERTQGFTWINSASAAGIAAGAALIGGAIELAGVRAAAVLLTILTLVALLSAAHSRGTQQPSPRTISGVSIDDRLTRRVLLRNVREMPEWNGLQISVLDLRLVFDRILAHVEDVNGESVVLREDYFYSLPAPNLYDVSSDPPEPTIGQLTESWRNLMSAMEADRTLNRELVSLGDVLRAIGHLLPEGEQRSTDR